MKKRIFISGGNGFIGRNFIEAYADKYEIYAPSIDELDLLKLRDVTDYLKECKAEVVLHLAGRDEISGMALEADNLIMFKNIQYAAIISGVKKLLLAGDVAEFDRRFDISNVSEDDFGKTMPVDGYGLSRHLINILASKDKISTNLRLFHVFGKYQDVGKDLVMEIVARAVTGKKPIVIDDERLFSTIYVDDVTKIIYAFIENDFPKGDYNIVNSTPLTYKDIAKVAVRNAKKDGRIVQIACTDDLGLECTASNEKLLSIMPKLKFTSLNKSVEKLYQHLRSNKSQCKPKK